MTQPSVSVVDEFVTLIDTNFTEGNVTGSKTILIDESDDLGKGRDLGVYDYIEVSTTSPLGIEYSDLFMDNQNIDATLFIELKSDDEDRRDDMFAEFRSIVEANRKRPDTPGDYDRMVFGDITPLDDETFGAYVYEIVIGFEARSRAVA